MKSCLGLTLVGAAALLAGAASAQTSISPGATAQGNLTAQDQKLGDDSYYRCYSLNTTASTVYEVTLESDDFDTYLAAGPGTDCEDLNLSNDDGEEMGTNSSLKFGSNGGRWTIRVNTLGSGETGAYRLSVSRGSAIVPTRDIVPLTLGASVAGELGFGDRPADDGSFYDCYRLQMRSEDTLAIGMSSDDFDAYLALHSGPSCEGEARATDDDSGGGTNAQLVERLGAGTYSIRANSLNSSAVGNYVLTATVRR